MRRSRLNTAIGLLAACACFGWAGPVSAGTTAPTCDQAVSTVELNACTEQIYEAADAALNVTYKKLVADIKSSSAPEPYDPVSWERALRKAQKAWLAFRDAECKDLVPMSFSGGTITTSAVFECLTAKTIARTKELDTMLNGEALAGEQ